METNQIRELVQLLYNHIHKNKMKNKKGQLKISFGMIFAIILIIIFIVFAFIAIGHFLSFQKKVQTNQFMKNLQGDINNAYQSQQSSNNETYNLPSNVVKVCFINSEQYNLEVFTKGSPVYAYRHELKYVDLNKTFSSGDSKICTNTINGKVSIKLSKDYYSPLVKVSV